MPLGHDQQLAGGDGVGERRLQRLSDRSVLGLDACGKIAHAVLRVRNVDWRHVVHSGDLGAGAIVRHQRDAIVRPQLLGPAATAHGQPIRQRLKRPSASPRLQFDEPQDDVAGALAGRTHGGELRVPRLLNLNQAFALCVELGLVAHGAERERRGNGVIGGGGDGSGRYYYRSAWRRGSTSSGEPRHAWSPQGAASATVLDDTVSLHSRPDYFPC